MTARTEPPGDPGVTSEEPTTTLVKDLAVETKRLLERERELIRLRLAERVAGAATPLTLAVVGGALGLVALLFAGRGLSMAMALVMPRAVAPLTVAFVFGVAAVGLVWQARRRLVTAFSPHDEAAPQSGYGAEGEDPSLT